MLRPFALVALVACLAPAAIAAADGKRDLEDGIAFYENLDTDRAIERLTSASKASDLSVGDRAKALVYLGIVQFETGKEREAEVTWTSAFGLVGKTAIPAGTSPKVVQAIEKVRKAGATAPKPTPSPSPSTPDVPKPTAKPSPSVTPPPTPAATPPPSPSPSASPSPADVPNPALVGEAPPPVDDGDSGIPAWLIWGGIGAAVVGGVIVAVLVATQPCASEGGCLELEINRP